MTAPIHIDGEIQSDTKKDDTSLLDVRLLRIDFSRQQASDGLVPMSLLGQTVSYRYHMDD